MGTITEDYVSFEVAKLFKEKGFPLPSTNFRDWLCCMYDENQNIHWGIYDENWYFRITHQMAMKWLREVHNILIIIIPQEIGLGFDKLCYSIYRITEDLYQPLYNGKTDNLVDSYEEAVEAGIKYCLENLI